MFELFKLAFNELYSNKARTLLTSLGISIGVMAVSLILSSGSLANTYLTDQLLSLTGDIKTIQINPFEPGRRDAVTILTKKDLEFVQSKEGLLPFGNIVPIWDYNWEMENFKGDKLLQTVTGSTANYFPQINKLEGLEGRFFSEGETDAGQNVAVVSRDFVKKRLGKSSALGDNITIAKEKFLVIGEFDQKGGFGGGTERVIMPVKALWRVDDTSEDRLSSIRIIARDQSQVDFVKEELQEQLNNYRSSQFSGIQSKPAGFNTAEDSLQTVTSILTAFQIFLALVAVISLVVGGIGVLNVMLMSVSQRIKEIGIRKAFGAKNKDILALFLSESILLTSLSGLFGAMLAQYFVYLGVKILENTGTIISFDYSFSSVYVSFLLSAVLGAAFGLYPAYIAGRMSVVEALRYE